MYDYPLAILFRLLLIFICINYLLLFMMVEIRLFVFICRLLNGLVVLTSWYQMLLLILLLDLCLMYVF